MDPLSLDPLFVKHIFEVSKLLAVEYRKWVADQEKANPGCKGKDGFPKWECCETHRELRQRGKSLESGAKKMNVPYDGYVLCANWWKAAGNQEMYEFTKA